MEPFATPDDLADRWRVLTVEEQARAATLLGSASRMIRRLFADVDDRVALGTLDAASVADVVCSMVERRMSGRLGVTQFSHTEGPFTDSEQYASPLGLLYLTAEERSVFDPVGTAGSTARSIWVY